MYLEDRLDLKNSELGVTPEGTVPPAGLLQLCFLGKKAKMTFGQSWANVVASGPHLEAKIVDGSTLRGALIARKLEIHDSSVLYDGRLEGILLKGRGPVVLFTVTQL